MTSRNQSSGGFSTAREFRVEAEYARLDTLCEKLTAAETFLGEFAEARGAEPGDTDG